MTESIYLDYAATAAVRPPEVAEAMVAYLRDVGATPGRSSHARALEAGRVALRCRRLLARLLGIPGDPGRITFHLNATHALNVALSGLLDAGDRVVRTTWDHNAVRRPLGAFARERNVRVDTFEIDAHGEVDVERMARLLHGDGVGPARLLALPHASNVTGGVLPVRELADAAHEAGALLLLDAAQTAGHHPIDAAALGVDLLAVTGHKGLLGPQGTGALWVRDGVDVRPLVYGGTGGDSAPLEMPEAYPDHLEAGTQNGPGLAGLAAALEWISARGVDALARREIELTARLVAGLDEIDGVRIHSSRGERTVGIVTFTRAGADPGKMALELERGYGIQARAGLHCAPDAHACIGTFSTGALRFSVGWATTEAEVDAAVDAVRSLAGGEGAR